MKLEPKDRIHIRKLFAAMQTKEDLLALLNFTKPLIYGGGAQPFELKQLTWHGNQEINRHRYASLKIRKKTKGSRTIHVPVPGLKAIQRVLNIMLQAVFEPHKAAAGFVEGRSVVDHARMHAGSNYVFNIDLKDFFPSIDQARVWKCFQLRPFNLAQIPENEIADTGLLEPEKGSFTTEHGEIIPYTVTGTGQLMLDKSEDDYEKYKKRLTKGKKPGPSDDRTLKAFRQELVLADAEIYIRRLQKANTAVSRLKLAGLLAALCCTKMEVERLDAEGKWITVERNVLPQGAPTSPVISNIVCQRLDFLLSGVSARFGLKYSRYADDISFSSMHNVYKEGGEFMTELYRVIESQHFHIKESKTRLQKEGYRQEVTGLIVNDKANVPKRYIKQLRMWLYYWERYGFEKAERFFVEQYSGDRAYRKRAVPAMERVISGKLEYLKMVRGESNKLYVALKKRFEIVRSLHGPINEVLDVWEQHGVEKAMEVYYNLNSGTAKTSKDFMAHFLEDKRMTELQRQRLLRLATGLVESGAAHLSAKIHSPIATAEKLALFKSGDKLKWITHNTPASFNYERVTRDAIAEFNEISRDLPPRLIGIISLFLKPRKTNPVTRFRYLGDLYQTWWSSKVKKWCLENPEMHPDTNPEISHDIIMPFKKSIEIRHGDDLVEAIKYSLKKMHGTDVLKDLKIDFSGVKKGTRFFTGVDQLMTGIAALFSPILKRKNISPVVKIYSGIRDINNRYVTQVTITHAGSDPGQEFSPSVFEQGDMKTAKSLFMSLCDWEVVANFTDGTYAVPLLSASGSEEVIQEDKVEGFTHKLIFY